MAKLKHGIFYHHLFRIRVSPEHGFRRALMETAAAMTFISGNEATSCWIYKLNTSSAVNWNTIHTEANFKSGRGYLYSVQALNPTKQFVGSLNNGNQSIHITKTSVIDTLSGFNLVGNPYPSSVDWQSLSGWNRSCLSKSNGGYDMWIWNSEANNYGVLNSLDESGAGTNGITRYISSHAGFILSGQQAQEI